jgi:predicted branched-subunit amino acid permease
MTAGAVGVENGLTSGQTILFGLVAFAAASQIAALELFGDGAPLAVVVGTATVINLRLLMYSASLATLLPQEPIGRRLWTVYLVTDHAYAVFVAQVHRLGSDHERRLFYLGAATAMWLTMELSTVLGAILGSGLLKQMPLEFAAPLSFLGLLIPTLVDKPRWAAAVVAGTVATLANGAPASLGMLGGALAGIVTGVLVFRHVEAQAPGPDGSPDSPE